MEMIFAAVLGIVVSVNAFAHPAGMPELLALKQKNYATTLMHYQTMYKLAQLGNFKSFCGRAEAITPVLNQILNDDHQLIAELKKVQDQDYYDYAKHLDDNSLSDLFANHIYLERCEQGRFEPVAEMLTSLNYSVMNVEYLSLTHGFWMARTK